MNLGIELHDLYLFLFSPFLCNEYHLNMDE
jgi:hypothetical protein